MGPGNDRTQAQLEAYGIVGYIEKENLCRIVPFARELPGFAMRVMVDAHDADVARGLLGPSVAADDES